MADEDLPTDWYHGMTQKHFDIALSKAVAAEREKWKKDADLALQPAPAAEPWGWVYSSEALPEDGDLVLVEFEEGAQLPRINFGHEIVEWNERDPIAYVERWIRIDSIPETAADLARIDALLATPTDRAPAAEPVAWVPPDATPKDWHAAVMKCWGIVRAAGCADSIPSHWLDAMRDLALTAPPDAEALTHAARDVLAERQRQISVEGWTPEHDDEHEFGQMAYAASSYARHAGFSMETGKWMVARPREWPWSQKWWKPSEDPRRNLIKAGALILAEIERLDRAALAAKGGES